jgi:DNA-directed RNA polymerase subunit RPC12/RpoP
VSLDIFRFRDNTDTCSFLVTNGDIDPVAEEIKMATMCIDYLNLPPFRHSVTSDMVKNGDFVFMDYAVLNWIRHLEVGTMYAHEQEELIHQLAESLETFLENHWNSPTIRFQDSKGTVLRLQFFKESDYYDKLKQTIASTRKLLTYFGLVRKTEIALDLPEIVKTARVAIEDVFIDSAATEPLVSSQITQKYGKNLFKCNRFSCQYFYLGFESVDDRDKHVAKHLRPFRCTDKNCTGFTLGFTTEREHGKHMKNTHPTDDDLEEQFPTDLDVEQSMHIEEPAPVLRPIEEKVQEATNDSPLIQVDESPEPEPVHMRVTKRQRLTEHKCDHCGKVFKKRYNWQSHLRIHGEGKRYKCNTCGKELLRLSDYNRHTKSHTGESTVFCDGCGKSFTRMDVLRTHHKSSVGQACVRYLQQKENDGISAVDI